MAKLYFFAIGGTGARVLRALTHLLASGLDMGGFTLVPVVVDADQSNGDTIRALDALNLYRRLREGYANEVPSVGDFFATEVMRPGEALTEQKTAIDGLTDFRLTIQNSHDRKFKDYISHSTLSTESQAMARLLFSEADLASEMVIGFEGRPHMGTIVLNQLPESPYYRNFASVFGTDDRIFIAGSIFGGTGAAGLPMLVKNIRNAMQSGTQLANMKNAKIGALVALPYYGLKDAETGKGIDGNKFRTMAKAALSYYEKNLINNRSINSLYTIGDEPHAIYENSKGGSAQTNPAHFVELASAMAISHFAKTEARDLETRDGRATSCNVLEFGTKNVPSGGRIVFDDLANTTRTRIEKCLVKYLIFENYIKRYFAEKGKDMTSMQDSIHFDKQFQQTAWYQDLLKYNTDFAKFIGELASNKDAFHPFAISKEANGYSHNEDEILSLVFGRPYIKTRLIGKSGPIKITDRVRDATNIHKGLSADKAPLRFLSAFNKGLEKVLKEQQSQLLPTH